jgi:hypothetical protein
LGRFVIMPVQINWNRYLLAAFSRRTLRWAAEFRLAKKKRRRVTRINW